MNKNAIKLYVFIAILSAIIIMIIIKDPNKPVNEKLNSMDLPDILRRGTIVATTDYNSTNYFIYKGQPMGFQYELLKKYAEHIGVDLEIHVSNDIKENFVCLRYFSCNIIAMDLTVTKKRSELVSFINPYNTTRQILVQRNPRNWQNITKSEIEDTLIRSQLDLAGKTIHIQNNTTHKKRLQDLADEIGDTIYIIETDEYETEQLIALVAKGVIDYTVCDEHIGMVNKTYYQNIDIKTAISFPQNLAWAVNKDATLLYESLNNWMIEFKKTREFTYLYRKYFKNPRSQHRVKSEFYSLRSGKISKYDDLIKKYSETIHWDWRLLASLIYQESRFQPDLVSWAGAKGLMQLMPVTGKRFGAENLFDPNQSIRAGTKFLKFLDDLYRDQIPDSSQRIKFILASYNAGHGHVLDAIELARKYQYNPAIWDNNVERTLEMKSMPKYFQDEVVKSGYLRSDETLAFVKEILYRYEQYKNVIPYQ